MVKDKCAYYSELNGLPVGECIVELNGSPTPFYAAEVDAIADDDPSFLAWMLQKEREAMILTPWGFRKALNAAGKRAEVEAGLAGMTQDELDGWHVASSFERLNPLVIKLAGEILGYNDDQIDAFFKNALNL
jgi:hypothetical protein